MDVKPGSSVANGRLWGSSAHDWATIQEKTCQTVYEATFEHVGVGTGTAYADLGCGAGLAAQMAGERGATVTGLDAAEALLEIARSRSPLGSFVVGELESLPFADDSFDLVTGFNAFQYAANPVAALYEAKRVAKAGATVVVMTWGEPAGMGAASLVAALKPLLPAPPPGAPGPFALSDETALRAFAAAAGLETQTILDVDSPWSYVDLDTALRGLRSSGVAARAMANSSVEAVDEAHGRALVPFRLADGSYVIDAKFRYLVARA
jgi:SAM-dependent methyltransferase